MPWDNIVPALFGGGFFASQPADEKRTLEWMLDLRKRGVGWTAARQQLVSWMRAEGWGNGADGSSDRRIKQQLPIAESMLKPWLID